MTTNELFQYGVPVLLIVGFLGLKRLGQISATKAHELVKQGAALVDVRSPGEYASGHLPGAKNVPVQNLSGTFTSLGPKDKPIVLYCASGTRSSMARAVLKAQGFTHVYNLGAMSRW